MNAAPPSPKRRTSNFVDDDNDDEPQYQQRRPSGTLISPGRSRLNSKEIPRTYSGLYGAGAGSFDEGEEDDNNNTNLLSPPRMKPSGVSNLLPFELSHNRNTDWIAAGGPALLLTYISTIVIFLLTFLAFITEPKNAWVLINLSHGLSTLVYLHWIKGNPADYMDGTQGEMNAMTTWEQIVSKPTMHVYTNKKIDTNQNKVESSSPIRGTFTNAVKKLRSRDVLYVVPSLLAHASCHVAKYEYHYVLINLGVWAVVMLPKLPFMNGVRLFGINRTIGIDDAGNYEEEDEDCLVDTEEETSKDSAIGYNFSDEAEVEMKKDR